MWVDYRGSLSTVYNDGEISTCGEIIEVHLVQSTIHMYVCKDINCKNKTLHALALVLK